MSAYTISSCLLSEANKFEISKILLKFLTEDTLKVVFDSGNRALHKYESVISERKDGMLVEWLRYVTDQHLFSIVDIGDVSDNDLFLEICYKAFGHNLFVYDKQPYADYCVSENIIRYNDTDLNIYDAGEAVKLLSIGFDKNEKASYMNTKKINNMEYMKDFNPNFPKIFISYSWDSKEHKIWVKSLADYLKSKGINVMLDQYLPKGCSLTRFMMDGIKQADKVLVIGTPLYKQKAESYKGGTNVEHQIININIGRDFDTAKFIPLLREGSFDTAFTDLIGDRNGYDFTNDTNFETFAEDLANEIIGYSS